MTNPTPPAAEPDRADQPRATGVQVPAPPAWNPPVTPAGASSRSALPPSPPPPLAPPRLTAAPLPPPSWLHEAQRRNDHRPAQPIDEPRRRRRGNRFTHYVTSHFIGCAAHPGSAAAAAPAPEPAAAADRLRVVVQFVLLLAVLAAGGGEVLALAGAISHRSAPGAWLVRMALLAAAATAYRAVPPQPERSRRQGRPRRRRS